MKISVLGNVELDGDRIKYSISIGKDDKSNKTDFHFEPHEFNWDSTWKIPFNLSGGLWIFRGKLISLDDASRLTEEEIKIEITSTVLRREKRYKTLKAEIDAFNNLEKIPDSRRERVPDSVRLFVWQRDEGKCVKCSSVEKLEYDHIIPVSKGGANTERNIQLLCEKCNRSKGANI